MPLGGILVWLRLKDNKSQEKNATGVNVNKRKNKLGNQKVQIAVHYVKITL